MATPMALNNVQFLVPVDGGVSKLQAILPTAAWYSTQPASAVADLIESYLLVVSGVFFYYQFPKCVFSMCFLLQEHRAEKNPLEDSRHLTEI